MKKFLLVAVIIVIAILPLAAIDLGEKILAITHEVEGVNESAWLKSVPSNVQVELGNGISGDQPVKSEDELGYSEDDNTFYAVVRTNSPNAAQVSLTVSPLSMTANGETYYYPMGLIINDAENQTPVDKQNITVSEGLSETEDHDDSLRIFSNKIQIVLNPTGNEVAGKNYRAELKFTVSGL